MSEPFDFKNVEALAAFKAHGEWSSEAIRTGVLKDDEASEKLAVEHAASLGLEIKCCFTDGGFSTRYLNYKNVD